MDVSSIFLHCDEMSGLRITFFAAEPELPGTRLSLWQSVDEDAPIAGDIEMSRSYEDRGKMA